MNWSKVKSSVHGNEIQDQEVCDGFPERKASSQPRSPSTLPSPQRRQIGMRDNLYQPRSTLVEQPFLSNYHEQENKDQRQHRNPVQPQRAQQNHYWNERQPIPAQQMHAEFAQQQYCAENVQYRVENLPERIPNARQIFEQQQEMFKLMATTIGSTISKGFEMPKSEYINF